MFLQVMKSKIHNATITEANINYEGSITIDRDLMDKSNIREGERVQVVNMANGNRLETYVIPAERGCKRIEMNGPAALLCEKGQRIHIIAYAFIEPTEKIDRITLLMKDINEVKEVLDHEIASTVRD